MESTATNKCAACGKEGGDSLKACTACFMVKYCNRDCQIAHRKQHKKECKQRAAELYDEKLFKEVEREECPICFLVLPRLDRTAFQICCGKRICDGCRYAIEESEGGKDLCSFCRTPYAISNEEEISRVKKLMEKGSGGAFDMIAGWYARGVMGMPQDWAKANELWLKAAELGSTLAYYNLGISYENGQGVEVDKTKAKHYYELSAMKGNEVARYNLGVEDYNAGKLDRAYKHFIIAAKAGDEKSLEAVKKEFMKGSVTKEQYANVLRAYHDRQKEIKNDMRDAAERFRLATNSI